jgi:hypothetical protein
MVTITRISSSTRGPRGDNEMTALVTGCSTSVAGALAPLEQHDWGDRDDAIYLTPYWTPLNVLCPCDVLAPYVGWSLVRPLLPRDYRQRASELWAFSDKASCRGKEDSTRTCLRGH